MIKSAFLMLVACFVVGCGPARYTVVQESNIQPKVAAPASVYVGWLLLDEQRYKEYGYENPTDFRKAVQELNGELRRGLKESWPSKAVTFAQVPGEPLPANVDLVILFENSVAEDTAGGMNGHNSTLIRTTVKFLDPKAQREINTATITGSVRGLNGWSMMNLEACLDQAAYNIAMYVAEKLN
jgi:hypothetical protein